MAVLTKLMSRISFFFFLIVSVFWVPDGVIKFLLLSSAASLLIAFCAVLSYLVNVTFLPNSLESSLYLRLSFQCVLSGKRTRIFQKLHELSVSWRLLTQCTSVFFSMVSPDQSPQSFKQKLPLDKMVVSHLPCVRTHRKAIMKQSKSVFFSPSPTVVKPYVFFFPLS